MGLNLARWTKLPELTSFASSRIADNSSLMPARLFEASHQSRWAYLSAIVAVVAMTIFITWPQALMMRTAFASHVDPYFSAWRIMWFAHALRTDPQRLFDGNIFHPSTGALAFSDATLLEGAVAAAFLWAGASPVTVYNTLLLHIAHCSSRCMKCAIR